MARKALWPTPRATDGEKGGPNQRGSKGDLALPAMVRKWPTPTVGDGEGSRTLPQGTTPTGRTPDGKKKHVGLGNAVRLWPTPTVRGNHNRAGLSPTSGDGLATAVRMWATPTAHERTHSPRPVHHGEQLANQVGGTLNPTWVEWLMGLPAEWTGSVPSATAYCRWLSQQRGALSALASEEVRDAV